MARVETGLTPTQKELLDLLWVTETVAPVTRRLVNPDGSFSLERYERAIRPIDFARDGEFALKLHAENPTAPLSPYYINLRNLPNNLLIVVAEAIAEATQGVEADFCTGIPEAGEPIAQVFSKISGMQYRRLFAKAVSGSGRRITAFDEAFYGKGAKLFIIDDLITEADTKWEAISQAHSLNYSVAGIVVLIDRQQGGTDQLKARGYKVFAPLPISRVFVYYYHQGMIDRAAYELCMNYLNNARNSASLPGLTLVSA